MKCKRCGGKLKRRRIKDDVLKAISQAGFQVKKTYVCPFCFPEKTGDISNNSLQTKERKRK